MNGSTVDRVSDFNNVDRNISRLSRDSRVIRDCRIGSDSKVDKNSMMFEMYVIKN